MPRKRKRQVQGLSVWENFGSRKGKTSEDIDGSETEKENSEIIVSCDDFAEEPWNSENESVGSVYESDFESDCEHDCRNENR